MNTTVERPTAATGSGRDTAILRHRLANDGMGLVWLAGLFWVSVTVLTLVVSVRVDITTSGWQVGTQIARWFVGAIGVYLTAVYLPLYVAHGRTRRETAVQLAGFGVVYVVLAGVLITAGYALETLVYALAGWEQGVEPTTFVTAATDHPRLLGQYLVLFAVWHAAGGLLGAAFYRGGGHGALALVPAVGAVIGIEWAAGTRDTGLNALPFFQDLAGGSAPAVGSPVVAAAGLVAAAVLVALTWLVVRDLPIRTPKS
ncbi:hypothetical protein [Egicoccus halophilus]|uniref:Uncharacterized protein n=1 Tax=Egicoccus halophilus TaxID=1670830 RepID=A0A8J3EVJ0_9ACTN|nr:hypothetical protein [Egicoccus halophilus]GGI08224.1 hypothetical protein GCM10011354_28020 [Egicoccus halophilus]